MTDWPTVPYIVLDELKDALQIDQTDDRRDLMLSGLIDSASRSIDDYCGRYFGQYGSEADPVTRTFDGTASTTIIDDLVSVSLVEGQYGTGWTTLTSAMYYLGPRNAATSIPAKPYTMLKAEYGYELPTVVRITGVWGWPDTPQPIREATKLQSIRLFKSKDVALGVVGGADMMGTLRLSSSLHPDAAFACSPFQRLSLG
jgi:hypothetical protein